MKLLGTGSRDWTNWRIIRAAFIDLPDGTIIVHGQCHKGGADIICDDMAIARGFPTPRRYPANWKKYGLAAGIIRNSQMLTEEHPDKDGVYFDACFAFHNDLMASKGTKDMAFKAYAAGIHVTVFTEDGPYTFNPNRNYR